MQTNFSLTQLADPDIAVANDILRACVHCGFCQATCPTYVLLGDELDSPRGRIYLIKEMLEHDAPATAEVVTHIDRCLSCLACMTTCPSGVHYMHLVDHARAHIEETYTRPLLDRLMRFLTHVMPYPRRLRVAMVAGVLGKPFAPLLAALGVKPFAAAARLAPLRAPGAMTEPASIAARALAGAGWRCSLAAPTRRWRRRSRRPPSACSTATASRWWSRRTGLLRLARTSSGPEAGAFAKARANIDAWTREIEGEGLDAVLITISGCGTTVKDYGFMLRTDPVYAARAAKVSSLTRDISEYLARLGLSPPATPSGLTVAFHSACSLQHGQRVHREPKDLLAACGFVVKDIPEAHLCCGSAGTYNILQPDIAARLRDRKVANIEKTAPDVIAAGNIGCIAQIASGTAIPVVHPVELIDWATGGPVPEQLQGRVN